MVATSFRKGPVRPAPDPFSTGADVIDGFRPSEEAWLIARRMSTRIGEDRPVIERYLDAFSVAPASHLRTLERRGARILFAPTIYHGLVSEWATERRQRQLSASEKFQIRTECSPESRTAAVYDESIDAIVLPTTYGANDLEHVVLHELGHALTVASASVRRSLLNDLPAEIFEHLRAARYGTCDPGSILRAQVLEVLADAYVFVAVGRAGELSPALLSEISFMLATVTEGEYMRFEFESDKGH